MYRSGQISIIPKPELRGFWGSSLIKPPFRVTSADVVIICPDRYNIHHGKNNSPTPQKWWFGKGFFLSTMWMLGVHVSHEKNPGSLTFHYGWLIGILIMVSCNPYITGYYNPLYNPTNQVFFCGSCVFC